MSSTFLRRAGSFASLALVLAATMRVGDAAPDPFVADTERVLADEARSAHRQRHVGGVICILLGGAALAGGYAATQVKDGGGLVDLSPVVRGFGYGLIAVGALNVIVGTTLFFVTVEQERMHADLRTAMARGEGLERARRVRANIAAQAEAERRTRTILRHVGLVTLGASVAAGAVALAIRNEDHDEWPFVVGALGGGVIGGGLLLGGAVDGHYTTMERRFAARTRVGIAPLPSGAAVGIDVAF